LRPFDLTDVLEEAAELMCDIDADDAPFLAAALSISCDGIWTEDPHFLKQSAIKVWRTRDLLHFIK
jgi:predicted nucleic acid-binding protein